METLKNIGIALGEIFLAILNAVGSVVKSYPKFFGLLFIISTVFLGCIISKPFMDFVAQIIALGIMIGLGFMIFGSKSQSKPPKKK